MVRRYYRWLKRRMVSLFRSDSPRKIPAAIHPADLQRPTPSLGLDLEGVREWFAAMSIDGSAAGSLAGYARQDFERFLRTVELVPADAKTGLEIGANPYFTTTLLSWVRPELRLSLTNYFGSDQGESTQTVTVEGPAGLQSKSVTFSNVNVETARLPFEDEQFDVVLYCEVLEHMTNDPCISLSEICRVLNRGGHLVLTTPNAARLESVTRLIAGLNIYDQYSGFGPYGRHNREYTVHEVQALLRHCGFEQEDMYTADVHENHAALHVRAPGQLVDLVGHRAELLGQYIFSRWRKSGQSPADGKPEWLYRSMPADDLSNEVPLTEPIGARH